jgi:hypothetical protein
MVVFLVSSTDVLKGSFKGGKPKVKLDIAASKRFVDHNLNPDERKKRKKSGSESTSRKKERKSK